MSLYGEIFIIPNGISTFDAKTDRLDIERCRALGIGVFVGDNETRPVEIGDEKVEVWFTSRGANDRDSHPESNWANHNYWPRELNSDEWFRRHPNFEKYGIFPSCIPVGSIAHVNEDENVVFFPPDFNHPEPLEGGARMLILRAAQLEHRYSDKGSFQETLAKLNEFSKKSVA